VVRVEAKLEMAMRVIANANVLVGCSGGGRYRSWSSCGNSSEESDAGCWIFKFLCMVVAPLNG
jgi:hypothetical protein